MLNSFRISFALLVAVFSFLLSSSTLRAEDPLPTVKSQMDEAYRALVSLQPLVFQRDAFQDSANEKKISELLATLAEKFHKIEAIPSKYASEPGFVATIKVLTDMLDDSKNRFNEGNKDYSLWRIKNLTSYCITCHTRFDDKVKFYGGEESLQSLSLVEQGEFFLATRQFDRAKSRLLEAALGDENSLSRIRALRAWLIVFTRVETNPTKALTTLNDIKGKIKLAAYETEELHDWIKSFTRWSHEKVGTGPTLVKAESLIRNSLVSEDFSSGSTNAVDLLRATAILHELLGEGKTLKSAERSKALYLLGFAYNELPLFFVHELSSMFLEQCIRQFPGSADARNSFRLYREIITLGFTGSSGTNLPDDVLLKFKELHDIAYGVPQLDSRVEAGSLKSRG